MYTIGYDLGSSSIKVALVEMSTGKSLAVISEPKKEMSMLSVKKGWAEQDPDDWWIHLCNATKQLLQVCYFSSIFVVFAHFEFSP